MGCDPFQMAMIHRTFRKEFGHISALVLGVAPGDTARSRVVGRYCDNMISVLHHHHAAEDDVLWPKLESRTTIGPDIDGMKAEHGRIDELVGTIAAIRSQWAPDQASTTRLADAVDDLCAALAEHFDHEEHTVVPVIAEHVTAAEWQEFIDRGAAYVNPRNVWFALAYAGFLLRDGSSEERRRFVDAVPLPLRVTLKLFGGHAFASYQRKLG